MILSTFFRKFVAASALVALMLLAVPLVSSADCWDSHCDDDYRYYDNDYHYDDDWYSHDSYRYPYVYQYPQQYNYPPTCTITIQPAGSSYTANSYPFGYPLLLTWSSSNATSASISPEVGSVSPNGSRIVYAKNWGGGRVYTMAVYGAGGKTSTCQTSSYYVPDYSGPYYPYSSSYVYPTTYTYPTYTYSSYTMPSTYVALTQIPYTGASFGVWGDALAWLSLTLLAVFAAATLYVYKRRELMALLTRRS
jgi:hypothetical protein